MSDDKDEKAEKKARTFDFMAMFQEARQTAIDRTRKEEDEVVNEVISPPQDDTDSATREMAAVMGFGSFGCKKETERSLKDAQRVEVANKKPDVKVEVYNSDDDDDESGDEKEDDSSMIGPPIPANLAKEESEEDDDEGEEEEDESDDPIKKIPLTNEIVLPHGKKAVSALAMDPSGARLASGGYDYNVKFYDFAGMDATFQSFRQMTPCESHIMKDVCYSNSGDALLVVAANCQAKVFTRDASELFTCMKGDMYIMDVTHTKGHTHMLNGGRWSPKTREEFMTWSCDGSLRLWDTTTEGKKHTKIVRYKDKAGRRTIPTAAAYSGDGNLVAAACQDGSIQVWDLRKKYATAPEFKNFTAHQLGTDTSSIVFSYDSNNLATRGGDDTLKLWDLRKFKAAQCEAKGLYNTYVMTDCCFSPDDKLLMTGTSLEQGAKNSRLVFLDRQSLNIVKEVEVEGSVVRCLWHPKLNQIAVGTSEGKVKLNYDLKRSQRGAKLCATKTRKKKKQSEIECHRTIFTPYALPMFRQDKPTSTKGMMEKDRKDPKLSREPDRPQGEKGTGGVVSTGGSTLQKFVAQTMAKRKKDDDNFDPRAAILRHAEEAEKNPHYVTPAYKKTQPHVIFAAEDEEQKKRLKESDHPLWKKSKKE